MVGDEDLDEKEVCSKRISYDIKSVVHLQLVWMAVVKMMKIGGIGLRRHIEEVGGKS